MSRYISKLPEPIKALAEKRRSECPTGIDSDELYVAFTFWNTPEKYNFWQEINNENYSVFFDLYPQKDKLDELIEWVNMEYPNFNLEDFNNKAKEIKGK